MSTELVAQPFLDGAHFSIAELMLANLSQMIKQPLNVESYAVDTQYYNRETITLLIPGDVKLQIMVQRPKP